MEWITHWSTVPIQVSEFPPTGKYNCQHRAAPSDQLAPLSLFLSLPQSVFSYIQGPVICPLSVWSGLDDVMLPQTSNPSNMYGDEWTGILKSEVCVCFGSVAWVWVSQRWTYGVCVCCSVAPSSRQRCGLEETHWVSGLGRQPIIITSRPAVRRRKPLPLSSLSLSLSGHLFSSFSFSAHKHLFVRLFLFSLLLWAQHLSQALSKPTFLPKTPEIF